MDGNTIRACKKGGNPAAESRSGRVKGMETGAMTITNPANKSRQGTRRAGFGPQLGFAGATLACFAAWAGGIATLHADFVVPLIAMLLLMFSAGFAALAWRHPDADPTDVTYWDTAGALLLIGLAVTSVIDPQQLVRIVATL